MAAHELGRRFILVDNDTEAIEVMAKRCAEVPGIRWEGVDPRIPGSRPGSPTSRVP